MTGNGSGIEEVSESSCLCASVLKKDAGVVEGDFNTETQRRRGTEFKMTEIGPIPEDWDVKPLSSIGIFSKGRGISRSESNSGVLPCVRYGEIYTDHNDYIKEFKSFISESVAINAKRLVDGDILFAGSGETKEEIGKAVAYLGGAERVYCGGDILVLSPFSDFDSKFLGYVCNSQAAVSQKSARGQGDAVVHIRTSNLAEVLIPVPPLHEQKKIAEALSDVDELLAAMMTLIEKKRAIKQGAMQELLTGKKRLVGFKNSESSCLCASVLKKDAGTVEGGFNTKTQRRRGTEFKMTEIGLIPEDWDVKRIGDIGQVVTGSTPPRNNSANWGGDFNWISAKDFNGKYISKTEEHITEAGKRFCRLLPENSVLVTCIASIGLNAISKKACATNQQINAVVCRVDSPEYLYYQICYRNGDLKLLAGQTAVPIIGKKQFEDVLIPVPPLPEQKKIAEVLSDMDAEIEALEAKRAKYESIKQGMMQELLTGKTRLV